MQSYSLIGPAKYEPWWWEAANRKSIDDTALPREVDIAVVGSGFTGLSAARTLALGGRDVLVLEDGVLGVGASTRNAGFLGRQLLAGFSSIMKRQGLQPAIDLYRGASDAYDFTLNLMKSKNIKCHLSERGRFLPAWNQAQYDFAAKEFSIQHKHTGLEGGMINANEMSQELRCEGGVGGLLITNTGSVHPGLYHDGLLGLAKQAGVGMRDRTRVTAINTERNAHHLQTERGIIKAKQVVIATNGYAGSETRWFRRRLVRARAFMAATEPLNPELIKQLIPSDRTYVDYSRNLFNYWRRAPDTSNRILFGGQIGFLHRRLDRIADGLKNDMGRVFPELEEVKFSHVWEGTIAFTVDRLPHISNRDSLYFAFGCNGAGLPMGTYIGHKTGLKILGSNDSGTPFDDLPFPLSPSIMGYAWYLPLLTAWARWQDKRGLPSSGH